MALLQLDDLMQAKPKPKPATGLVVTPAAAAKVTQMLESRPEMAGKALRVYVTSGGCAGYQYGMAFDAPTENDSVLEYDGLKVVVDKESLQWLGGAQVDYSEGSLMGSGFSITNPNAEASCGCGHSFSKGDSAPASSGDNCC